MADYTDLSNAAVGIGGLPSGATVTALRDNPIAIAENTPNAPFIERIWYPYDAAVSGGGDGVIYDHSIDGSVFGFEGPAFEVGYDYLILAEGISHAVTLNSITLFLYRETSASYVASFRLSSTTANNLNFSGVEVHRPYTSLGFHMGTNGYVADLGAGDGANISGSMNSFALTHATPQRLSKFKLECTDVTATILSGKVYLYRRKSQV